MPKPWTAKAKPEWSSRWKPGDRVLCPHYQAYVPAVLEAKKPGLEGCWGLRKFICPRADRLPPGDPGGPRWSGITYHNEFHGGFRAPDAWSYPEPPPLPPYVGLLGVQRLVLIAQLSRLLVMRLRQMSRRTKAGTIARGAGAKQAPVELLQCQD